MEKILKNKVIWYTFTRYLTYVIKFISSLLIAKYLGPYYLGVWGFVNLILLYLSRFNFGISNSVNAIISVHKHNNKYVGEVIGVGASLLLLLSLIIFLFFMGIHLLGIDIGAKYSFMKYVPYVILIAILSHFNLFFSNVFRVYGKIAIIAFNQSIQPISVLLVAFFYRGEELLFALIITFLITVLLSFSLYVIYSPVSFKPRFYCDLAKKIQKKALFLFIYNASFYLIIITTKSFISNYYSVTEFGIFTFAFTLASAVLLLFEAISFLIFPKLLNRFSSNDNVKAVSLLNILRDSYITISHFSMHLIIFLFPFLLKLFPEYESANKVFVFIGLTVVTYTNSFGYQGLIIAKEKERALSLIAFLALVLNIVLNFVLTNIISVSFDYVILATMLTYFIYVFILSIYGRKTINLDNGFFPTLIEVFPIKWMLPYILSLVLTVYFHAYIWVYIIPPILFIMLNKEGLKNTFYLALKIIHNPQITDI